MNLSSVSVIAGARTTASATSESVDLLIVSADTLSLTPAAFCRKIALASPNDEIEVWGDGQQTRSYCYIDDCVEGIHRLMRSAHRERGIKSLTEQ